MPARLPIPFPIRLDGAAMWTVAAPDEPTDTPTQAPGANESGLRVAPPTPGPGYTRAPADTA